MADETNDSDEPTESDEPDATTSSTDADTPTQEHAIVDDASATVTDETQPAVAATVAPPPDSPARERSSLTVPTWAAVVAGVVVFALLLGGSFALGRSTAENDDGASQAISVPSVDEIPRFVPGTPDELPRGAARAFFGVSVDAAQGGVTVLRVSSGSPAEDAGFREGDLITKVDGDDVATPAEFADAIHEHAPGDEVTLTYTRDGDTNEATVHLQDRLQQSTPND